MNVIQLAPLLDAHATGSAVEMSNALTTIMKEAGTGSTRISLSGRDPLDLLDALAGIARACPHRRRDLALLLRSLADFWSVPARRSPPHHNGGPGGR